MHSRPRPLWWRHCVRLHSCECVTLSDQQVYCVQVYCCLSAAHYRAVFIHAIYLGLKWRICIFQNVFLHYDTCFTKEVLCWKYRWRLWSSLGFNVHVSIHRVIMLIEWNATQDRPYRRQHFLIWLVPMLFGNRVASPVASTFCGMWLLFDSRYLVEQSSTWYNIKTYNSVSVPQWLSYIKKELSQKLADACKLNDITKLIANFVNNSRTIGGGIPKIKVTVTILAILNMFNGFLLFMCDRIHLLLRSQTLQCCFMNQTETFKDNTKKKYFPSF